MAADARSAVLEQLVAASVEFDAIARSYAAAGMLDEAELAHDYALRVNRMYDAENKNIPPRPPCGCLECSAIYAAGER